MSFKTFNGANPTTAALTAVTTGTSIKTMLQIAAPSTRMLQIIAWGYTLSSTPAAGDAIVELIQTDVAATVTAHVAAGIYNSDPNGSASLVTLGTSATGYTATVEGSTTVTRVFDTDQVPTAAGSAPTDYDYQFMPDERPVVAASKFLRVRMTTAGGAVNALTWVSWNEI
jgi:hypothetical protein